MAAPVALQVVPTPLSARQELLPVSAWLPLLKWGFPSSSAKERNFCNSGESTSGKAAPARLWITTVWEKIIIARNFLMHGEKAHEMKGKRLESVLCISPARSGYSFRLWHICILKRDSRRATLSKAVQDQSEDKPLPVVLMLTQG